MKQISLFILIVIFSSCSETSKLNNTIDNSQRESLKNSPFETADRMTVELEMQKKHRPKYENDLNEIKKGNNWNSYPKKYGTDDCFDGGHTFYTVFYPTGKIESMYMRCWTPKEFRKDE